MPVVDLTLLTRLVAGGGGLEEGARSVCEGGKGVRERDGASKIGGGGDLKFFWPLFPKPSG